MNTLLNGAKAGFIWEFFSNSSQTCYSPEWGISLESFCVLWASLQCCLVAWRSSSIVQGYHCTQSCSEDMSTGCRGWGQILLILQGGLPIGLVWIWIILIVDVGKCVPFLVLGIECRHLNSPLKTQLYKKQVFSPSVFFCFWTGRNLHPISTRWPDNWLSLSLVLWP